MSKFKLIAVSGLLLTSISAVSYASAVEQSSDDSSDEQKHPATASSVTEQEASERQSELTNFMSFAGYTGLFHTPNAEVLPLGQIDLSYNNQLDYRGNSYLDGHNFIFAAGLFEGLEVSGMIASNTIHDDLFRLRRERERGLHNDRQKRDLSFNFKYQLPYIPENWFQLAVGVKDLGGAANQYETYYVAASREWGQFRFSTGFGRNSRSHGQMDGVFAGVEWQPWDWFALQLEHDAEALNAGARVTIPERWLFNLGTISLTSRFYSDTDIAEHESFWGVSFRMPLSRQAQHKLAVATAPEAPQAQQSETEPRASAGEQGRDSRGQDGDNNQAHYQNRQIAEVRAERQSDSTGSLTAQAQNLRAALLADGFESVSVGFNQQPHIVVSFENYIFNRNDLDALGLVLGRIAEHVSEANARFSVQLENHGIPMVALSGDISDYREFILGHGMPQLDIKRGRMQPVSAVSWVGMPGANSPFFKPRLVLSPSLTTRIATELGVYDYSLALEAAVNVPMWRGGGLYVSGEAHVAHTDDFEQGRAFGRFRHSDGLTQATLYHTQELPFGIYNQTHVGFFKEFHDFTGIQNETTWLSNTGRHQVSAEFGYFEYNDFNADFDYQTVSYRYNWFERDVSLHATAGRFFWGDEGAKVEARFWFGDGYLAVFAHETDTQVAGLAFSIPLSFRKDLPVTRYGQVRANESWRHGVSSRIGESDNALAIGRALQLDTGVSLDRSFLNQGRLSSGYIRNNLMRLRDSYLTYR